MRAVPFDGELLMFFSSDFKFESRCLSLWIIDREQSTWIKVFIRNYSQKLLVGTLRCGLREVATRARMKAFNPRARNGTLYGIL
jgi:hypothetical protein